MTGPTFRCLHYARTLSVACCLKRQGAQRSSATRGRRKGRVVTLRALFPHCASGECHQGNEHAAKHAVPESVQVQSFRIGGR